MLEEAPQEGQCDCLRGAVQQHLIESKTPVLHKQTEQLSKFHLKMAATKDELPTTVRKQTTNFSIWMCICFVMWSHANESVGVANSATGQEA